MNEQEQELRIYSGISGGSEHDVGQSEYRTVKQINTLASCAHHSLFGGSERVGPARDHLHPWIMYDSPLSFLDLSSRDLK